MPRLLRRCFRNASSRLSDLRERGGPRKVAREMLDDLAGVDQAELPLVLNRKSETSKGEVWLVNTQSVGPPRRLAVVSGHPRSALVCTSVTGAPTLQVSVDLRTTKEINAAPGLTAAFLRVDTFDLATGQLIVQ